MVWKNLIMGAALMFGAPLVPSLLDEPVKPAFGEPVKPAKPAGPSLRDRAAALSRRIAARSAQRRTITILEPLDPHLRRDIGLTEEQTASFTNVRRPSALWPRSFD